MIKRRKKLGIVKSDNNTGFNIDLNQIEKLEYENYKLIRISVIGDNPKNVIKEKIILNDTRNKWVKHIAKTAGKWYPNESITEYLIYRIGKILGFNMAESRLVVAEDQIRFLSKFFLKNNEQLSHGKELYSNSRYFGSNELVEKIEYSNKSREQFTLQITEKTIKEAFPEDGEKIFKDFIKMLIFDCYIGNNDRHYENWAIVSHIEGKYAPYFSPIYDTARGLFWNESEEKLKAKFYPIDNKKFDKYARNSTPKIGWDNEVSINHFNIFKLIIQNEYGISRSDVLEILSHDNLVKIFNMINNEFRYIISEERSEIIKSYLDYRRNKLLEYI